MHNRLGNLTRFTGASWVVFTSLILLGLFSGRSQGQQPEEKFQRTFTISNGGTLSVENYKGTIHITGSDAKQVVVDVTKRFEGSESERKWWMENVKINFRNESSHVWVEVKYPTVTCTFCWETHTGQVDLEIQVPQQTNVDLDGYKPDIRVVSLQGDIRIKSYKAPMTIDSTSGSIRIDTYKDTIRLKNVAVRGGLDIRSYKADTQVEAKSLEGSSTLESGHGTIVVRLPASIGLNIDYSGGRRASFHSDFPMPTRDNHWKAGDLHGTINQGGAQLRLRTERGSVSLEKMAI